MSAIAKPTSENISKFWPNVAIVNTPSSGVSDTDAEAFTIAISKQVVEHFGPLWHTYADLNFYPSASKVPSGMWVVFLLDSSDQAGALGYHDLTPDGLPLGKVFAGTDRRFNQSISVTLSHEVLEMLGDPYIDTCIQGPDGKFYAYEAADACEGDQYAYEIDGVKVSDFVTPEWFGANASHPQYDYLGHISSPLQIIADGYIGVFDPASGKGWTQITAEKDSHLSVPGGIASKVPPPHAIPKVGSRRERRFRGKANWNLSTYPI